MMEMRLRCNACNFTDFEEQLNDTTDEEELPDSGDEEEQPEEPEEEPEEELPEELPEEEPEEEEELPEEDEEPTEEVCLDLPYNATNVNVPERCNMSEDNETICCDESRRNVCYNLTQANEWFNSSISEHCQLALSEWTNCADSNDVN